MSGHDELIARLTRRLRVDPELRMDVAAELRAHLEDSEADFRAAGDSAEQAAIHAAEALGEEAELAEQLWRANRGRIGLHRACKWAARVALVPGAILVTLVLAWGAMDLGNLFHHPWYDPTVPAISRFFPERTRARMTEDQRFRLWGDTSRPTYVEQQKAIVERWPDDPVLYANYVAIYLARYGDDLPILPAADDDDADAQAGAEETLATFLAELERGERVEPDNGLYGLLASAVLVQASAVDSLYSADEDEAADAPPYVRIADPAMFERGLAKLREAAAKPACIARSADMAAWRLEAIPPSRRLTDTLLAQTAVDNQSVEDWLNSFGLTRRWARIVLSYARQLAETSRGEEALDLNRQVQMLITAKGAHDQTLIELLNDMAVFELAKANEAEIREARGEESLAGQMREQTETEREEVYSNFRSPGDEENAALSCYHRTMISSYIDIDPAPARTAEYALIEQVALAGLLGCVLLVTLTAGLWTAMSLIFRRGDSRARLLFVGWRRLGRICLLAIVVPTGLYAAYAHLAPFSPQRFGAWYAVQRLTVEYAAAGMAILALLAGLTYRAVRGRAAEAGLTVPPPPRIRNRRFLVGATALAAVGVIAFIIAWELVDEPSKSELEAAGPLHWTNTPYGYLLAGVIALLAVAWGLRESWAVIRLRGELAVFRRTLIRSSVPVLAAAVILIGLLCGVAARQTEAAAVGRLTGAALPGVHNELERYNGPALRRLFARRHAELTGEVTPPR